MVGRFVSVLIALAGCSFEGAPGGSTLVDSPGDPDTGDAPPTSCAFTEVSAAGAHTCALREDGAVFCWGLNDQGEAARPPMTRTCEYNAMMYSCEPSPVRAELQEPIVKLGAGDQNHCAISANKLVYCWGANDSGQFGGSLGDQYAPKHIVERDGADEIYGGTTHFCSRHDQQVKCSGDNSEGQLGNSTFTDSLVIVDAYSDAREIAVGDNTSCAIKSNDDLHCWGRNDDLQVDNSGTDKSAATRVPVVPKLGRADVGSKHICALLPDQTVTCWGDNESGQLGRGTKTDREAPAAVTGIAGASHLSVGNVHACAILEGDGAVRCWGEGFGATPVPIALPARATAIAVGSYHACAIVEPGDVHCWGLDWYGQRGTGVNNPAEEFQPPVRTPIPCD